MLPSILTVDDAKAVRLLVEKMLRPFQVEAREASNGYNALFAMEKSLPSLLILDVNMPVMGGLELLQMMKSNATLKKVPVIILTSPTDHPVLAELQALGPEAFIQKPFKEAALLEAIGRIIRLKPTG